MKKILMLMTYLVALFSCKESEGDLQEFLPGEYVRFSDGEMRTQYDTLRIERISPQGSTYRLLRSSSYQKKLDGQTFPWQSKKEEWTAIYDKAKGILFETAKGRVISFSLEQKVLFVGSTQYKKIR